MTIKHIESLRLGHSLVIQIWTLGMGRLSLPLCRRMYWAGSWSVAAMTRKPGFTGMDIAVRVLKTRACMWCAR